MSKVKFYSPTHTLSGTYHKGQALTFLTCERTKRVYTRIVSPETYVRHTTAQQIARNTFTELRQKAQHILNDPELRKMYQYQWTKQRKYKTLLGFVMHDLSEQNKPL